MVKAIHPGGSRSLEETESFDSLDSFFEDDFDKDTPEEGINKTLSCSKLSAVPRRVLYNIIIQTETETKSILLLLSSLSAILQTRRHKDWVSGEVKLPIVQCPRCLSHWCGTSPHHCEEQLDSSSKVVARQLHSDEEGLKHSIKVQQNERDKSSCQVFSC